MSAKDDRIAELEIQRKFATESALPLIEARAQAVVAALSAVAHTYRRDSNVQSARTEALCLVGAVKHFRKLVKPDGAR